MLIPRFEELVQSNRGEDIFFKLIAQQKGMKLLPENSKNEGTEGKKKGGTSKVRSRVWMYTQQISDLPFDSTEALVRRIKTIPNLDKIAWIIHDKDVNKEGKKVSPHVHVGFTLTKRTTISRLSKMMNDRPQQITCFTKRGQSIANSTKNLMGYLVHHTKEAKQQGKHQYASSEVHANFDYESYVEQTEEITSTRDILDEYANENISRDQAESLLKLQGGSDLAHNLRNLDALDSYILEEKRRRWVQTMKETKKPIYVVWLSGAAGTGKTTYAKHYAEKHGLTYFVTTSQNDPFQGYQGQQVLIIDEIRPETLSYADLLQICDPYLYEKNLTARYRNPSFQSSVVFLTSVYTPLEMYNAMRVKRKIDTFNQLKRRIGMNLDFSNREITSFVYDFDYKRQQWFTMRVESIPNPYSTSGLGNMFTFNELDQYGEQISPEESLKYENHQSRPKQSDD